MMECWVRTGDGQAWKLPTAVSWVFRYGTDTPCDSFSLRCLWERGQEKVLSGAYRFYADWEGRRVFTGVVDEFAVVCGGGGLTLELEGRGMAALLLDNESEALTYGRALLSEILGNHVLPYGITVDVRQDVSGGGYAVASGSSQWKALHSFTHRYGGYDPYFTSEGVLVAGPLWGSGKMLRICDDSPLLSLRKRESRYGVISQVLIQDKVQGVRHPVVNREFTRTGGQRRHVLYMPRSTAEDRRYTGEYQIEQSALEQLEIDLELPLPFAAMPGDRVELSLDRLHLTGTYEVVRSRSRMDGDGERTELTVSRR